METELKKARKIVEDGARNIEQELEELEKNDQRGQLLVATLLETKHLEDGRTLLMFAAVLGKTTAFKQVALSIRRKV